MKSRESIAIKKKGLAQKAINITKEPLIWETKLSCDFPLNAFYWMSPCFLPYCLAVPICFCSQSLVNAPLFCLNWHPCGIISRETLNGIICSREGCSISLTEICNDELDRWFPLVNIFKLQKWLNPVSTETMVGNFGREFAWLRSKVFIYYTQRKELIKTTKPVLLSTFWLL